MKLKVNFHLPTKDFKKSEWLPLTVTAHFEPTDVLSGDPEYSVVLPDYMFNELANTEPQFNTEYDPNNRKVSGLFAERTLTPKFKKTQTSKMISGLQSYVASLTSFLNEKYSIEAETLKKKIFIQFDNQLRQTKNDLNGAYQGEQVGMQFRYFLGYEVMSDKYRSNIENFFDRTPKKKYISRIYYASEGSSLRHRDTNFQEGKEVLPLTGHNESVEAFEKRFSIIDWTPEREAFCEEIKNKFIKLNADLSMFLKNIDNDKFDKIIANRELNLLN